MEDNANLLETLLERAADYSKTSIELVKLKTLDKTADIVSSLVPLSIVILLIASFLLFLSLGIAEWLGDILGKEFYGFFTVGGFYFVLALISHFFLRKRIKRLIGDTLIKHVLK